MLFYLDDSRSIKAVDSVGAFDFHRQWNDFTNRLSSDFDIRNFYFSDNIKDSFSGFDGKKTKLNSTVEYTKSVFKRKNTGAVIVATDGILNSGNNPIYENIGKNIPIYTIGIGDTTQHKDVLVKEINHNSLVFLNNSFNVIAHIQAYGFKGNSVKASIMQSGKELNSQTVNFDSENDYKTIEFIVDADKPGHQRYTIKLSELDGEQTFTNNKKDFYVEVIDGREKILILYQSPHPDVNAIASALSENKNLEVITKFASTTEESELREAGLVIGHQFPALTNKDARLMDFIKKNKIPFWAILGAQSPIDQITNVLPDIRIQRRSDSWNDAQPAFNEHFTAFGLSSELVEQSRDFPPLSAPFGQYSARVKFETLIFQKINKIQTDYPLIAFSESDGVKNAWTFGEGIWRWRITDFARNNSPELFNELINKTARYLMLKEDKRRFRAYPVKNEFDENESVKLQGELFDQNFEPIDDAEISVTLINEDGKEFPYRMSNTGAGYELDAGVFEAGYYRFKAQVNSRPEFEKINSGFLIKPIQLEQTQLKADFDLLKEWSAGSNGKFFYKDQFDQLENELLNNAQIKPLLRTKTKIEEFVKLRNLLLLIALFLAGEWFVRKWEGGY